MRLGAAGLLLLATSGTCPRTLAQQPGDDVRTFIVRGADSLDAAVGALGVELRAHGGEPERIGAVLRAFRRARVQYKRLEAVAEFYAPALAATLNSRRQEVDDDDAPPPSLLFPTGFPGIEALLGDLASAGNADSAARIADAMRPPVARLRALAMVIVPTDAQLIELARLELVRVSTLGIAGFDAPGTGEAMRESAAALDGVRTLYAATGARRWPTLEPDRQRVDRTLSRAIAYLRDNPDFVSFDRLRYLVDYGEPAAAALDSLRRTSGTVAIRMRRGLRADVASPFVAGAFDTRAYTPHPSPASSPELVSLGARLFFEPALSGTGGRSCSSCHDVSRAFTDGVARAAAIDEHGGLVARNTPTLINAGLEPAQFADERAVTLEDQIVEVLRSPSEMASSVEHAAGVLAAMPTYRRGFATTFGGDDLESVTPLRLRQALAAYVRSLVGLDSRFDRAVRGDTAILTAEEHRGFNLFMGKGGCGTCHFAPLFSGNTPPLYVNSDVEVIGTPASPLHPSIPDADSGRIRIDGRLEHLRAFKTPSLRNVALTAPYMHHGAFATLDDVVRFYDGGGGSGAGAALTNQTLSADSLHLTTAEQRAIVAFLGTLTDTLTSNRRYGVSPRPR